MIFIVCCFRLCGDFLFGRCGSKNFLVLSFFRKLGSAFFLLLQPFGIDFLFFRVKIAVKAYQLTDTPFYLLPRKSNMRLIVSNTLGNADALAVVLLVDSCTYNDRIRTTGIT